MSTNGQIVHQVPALKAMCGHVILGRGNKRGYNCCCFDASTFVLSLPVPNLLKNYLAELFAETSSPCTKECEFVKAWIALTWKNKAAP